MTRGTEGLDQHSICHKFEMGLKQTLDKITKNKDVILWDIKKRRGKVSFIVGELGS